MSNKTSIKQRQSGIELLKIVAMFLIVTFHCVQSMRGSGDFIQNNININQPTTDFTIFIIQFFGYFGALGNACFLLSSVWFLIDSNNVKLNKIAYMLLNVYVISVIFLLFFYFGGIKLSDNYIIKSLFPTIFSNNWYITCYMLLYAFYPLLNIIIGKLTQKQQLAYCCAFFILYMCIGCIDADFFFGNSLIHFIGIYFIVAYFKKYNLKIISSLKINIIMFSAGISLLIVLLLVMNFAGLHINIVAQNLLHFSGLLYNPIILLTAFSMFNIFRNLKIKNKIINYISALTMIIYLVHENILFRDYLRSALIFKFWEICGKLNAAIFSIICGLALFAASTVIAIVYNKLLQPIAENVADKLLELCLKLYGKFEEFWFKVE